MLIDILNGGRFDFILDTVSAPHDYNAYLNLLRRDSTMVLAQVAASRWSNDTAGSARRVGKCATSIKLDLPKADVEEKTISADGQTIDLTIVRPMDVKQTLPVFGSSMAARRSIGRFPTAIV